MAGDRYNKKFAAGRLSRQGAQLASLIPAVLRSSLSMRSFVEQDVGQLLFGGCLSPVHFRAMSMRCLIVGIASTLEKRRSSCYRFLRGKQRFGLGFPAAMPIFAVVIIHHLLFVYNPFADAWRYPDEVGGCGFASSCSCVWLCIVACGGQS